MKYLRYLKYLDAIDIPVLKEKEIYISHVGDMEYNFNVFGSAHLDIEKFLSKLCEDNDCPRNELSFRKNSAGNKHFYVVFGDQCLAYVTVEKIDPEELPEDM